MKALSNSVKDNSKECMSLCLRFIQEATPQQRSNIAIQTLINSFDSTAPSSLLSAASMSKYNENNDKMMREKISKKVLFACLSSVSSSSLSNNHNANNDNNDNNNNKINSNIDAIKPRLLLPILSRIQTVHTGNVPDKGTTVWYLQQKATEINDVLHDTFEISDEKYSSNGTNSTNIFENSRTICTVHRIEALEGKLIGIHKDGKEEPYYTISLSTPINGSAGNTVREIQTNGYR